MTTIANSDPKADDITASARRSPIAWIVGGCLLATVVFFAPRLWLMQHYVPGSFQWDRAHTYLLQSADPLRRDIEPAMLWRILPPLIAHAAHLRGSQPLVIPWIGVLAAATYVAVLFRRQMDDWRFVAGGTLLLTTTSAFLVPIGWLGMNDAWTWLGLLVVAFGRGRWALPVATLLTPWVDERFIIGFPLAWMVRRLARSEAWTWRAALESVWLLPYAVLRLALARNDHAASEATDRFVVASLHQASLLVPLAPLGWWMGLRAGWVAIGYACWSATGKSKHALTTVSVLTLVTCLLLASDLSRSAAILSPLVVWGCFHYARSAPATAPRMLLALGIANLLIPAAHVTYTHVDPISPLPIEIGRVIRIR